MNEDLTIINENLKTERVLNFYKKNKKKIFAIILVIIIFIFSIIFYKYLVDKKITNLSKNYIYASIQAEEGKKNEATNNLKKIIYSNEPTYSSLALFFLIEKELIVDLNEILNLYDHVINNNKFDKEMKNLLIYKKALALFERSNEMSMVEILKPIINSDSVLKSQAQLLLGDFFVHKKNYLKAKDLYLRILNESNQDNYKILAKDKLESISNEIN